MTFSETLVLHLAKHSSSRFVLVPSRGANLKRIPFTFCEGCACTKLNQAFYYCSNTFQYKTVKL